MVLTWRAAGLSLLAVLVALVTGVWGWVVLAVCGLLVLTDLLLCASPRRVRIRRGGDSSVRLGETAETWFMITNLGRRRLRGLARNAWIPSAGATGGIRRIDVPAGQRRRWPTTLHPVRRGDRRAGPLVIRVIGPLGFAGRQRAHDVPMTVRVLPPFTSRKHLPSRLARLRELDGRSVLLQRGQGTEFDSLREYVPGDDVRSIEWRATARASAVIVKTWRPERDRHVLIVIDSGRTSAGRVGDQPRLDHHLDAALLLAALASRAGDRVDLLIIDREVRASVEKSSPGELIAALVTAMAPVEPVLVEADHQLMIREAMLRLRQRSLVVLLTGLDASSVQEGLIPSLPTMLRRHKVVIASVTDPRLVELTTDIRDAEEAYGAAAVEADRLRRLSTADQVRRLGVSIVQAPPESFAPALADHYLALKKAGQL